MSMSADHIAEKTLTLSGVAETSSPHRYVDQNPNRTYAVPIPEHLKFHHIPNRSELNTFITDIYPNMKIRVTAKIRNHASHPSDVDEIINNFIAYMLSTAPTQNNVPRFTLYDPIKWPDQPFFKYWLQQLAFFIMSYSTNKGKDAYRFIAIEERDEYSEQTRDTISLDELFSETPENASVDYVYSTEILESIVNYTEQHQTPNPDAICFENYAARLFSYKLEGYSNREIADIFKISPQGVIAWQAKLRTLVSAFTGEEAQESISAI